MLSEEGLVKVGEGELDEIRHLLQCEPKGRRLELVLLLMGVFEGIHWAIFIIVLVNFLRLWRRWWAKERRPRLAHAFLHQVNQILP
jgi:hypothetical protein